MCQGERSPKNINLTIKLVARSDYIDNYSKREYNKGLVYDVYDTCRERVQNINYRLKSAGKAGLCHVQSLERKGRVIICNGGVPSATNVPRSRWKDKSELCG